MLGKRLILATLVLTPLLGSCATFQGSNIVTKIESPSLDAPPKGAIDALETKAKKDKPTATWIVKLANHYKKLMCNSVGFFGTCK